MNATCPDETGKSVVMPMGCYGIGVSRIVAAAVEQNHDDNGIIWPDAIAVPRRTRAHRLPQVRRRARRRWTNSYGDLTAAGLDVLLDDRDERPA